MYYVFISINAICAISVSIISFLHFAVVAKVIQDLFELSCEYIEYFTLRVRSTKTSVKS